jgi:hypothetical protein
MERAMSLTVDDRLEIHEVIALHGHLCDAGAYGRFDEVPRLEPGRFGCQLHLRGSVRANESGLAHQAPKGLSSS